MYVFLCRADGLLPRSFMRLFCLTCPIATSSFSMLQYSCEAYFPLSRSHSLSACMIHCVSEADFENFGSFACLSRRMANDTCARQIENSSTPALSEVPPFASIFLRRDAPLITPHGAPPTPSPTKCPDIPLLPHPYIPSNLLLSVIHFPVVMRCLPRVWQCFRLAQRCCAATRGMRREVTARSRGGSQQGLSPSRRGLR